MDKARTFYWFLSLSPLAHHILRRILTFMRIPEIYGLSAPLENILYHKNVSMIVQGLGSNGYLSLIYSLIAHSITSTQTCCATAVVPCGCHKVESLRALGTVWYRRHDTAAAPVVAAESRESTRKEDKNVGFQHTMNAQPYTHLHTHTRIIAHNRHAYAMSTHAW